MKSNKNKFILNQYIVHFDIMFPFLLHSFIGNNLKKQLRKTCAPSLQFIYLSITDVIIPIYNYKINLNLKIDICII